MKLTQHAEERQDSNKLKHKTAHQDPDTDLRTWPKPVIHRGNGRARALHQEGDNVAYDESSGNELPSKTAHERTLCPTGGVEVGKLSDEVAQEDVVAGSDENGSENDEGERGGVDCLESARSC